MDATERCLGAGLSYRAEIHGAIAKHLREIDFLEIVTDHLAGARPEQLDRLSALLGSAPLVARSTRMSLGSALPVPSEYIETTSQVARALRCLWIGEDLSYCRAPGCDVGEPVPLWPTEETLEILIRNVLRAKAVLGVPLLLQNVTHYYRLPGADMSEAELLTRALEATDSGLLLDIHHLHIDSLNLGFDPYSFLSEIPLERVVQVHLAGGQPIVGMVVDRHGTSVHADVWRLLEYVVRRSPVRGVVLEWDHDFPAFSVLREHLLHARRTLRRLGARGAR
jgi:uncharacterized protein (UPF0276 family)